MFHLFFIGELILVSNTISVIIQRCPVSVIYGARKFQEWYFFVILFSIGTDFRWFLCGSASQRSYTIRTLTWWFFLYIFVRFLLQFTYTWRWRPPDDRFDLRMIAMLMFVALLPITCWFKSRWQACRRRPHSITKCLLHQTFGYCLSLQHPFKMALVVYISIWGFRSCTTL